LQPTIGGRQRNGLGKAFSEVSVSPRFSAHPGKAILPVNPPGVARHLIRQQRDAAALPRCLKCLGESQHKGGVLCRVIKRSAISRHGSVVAAIQCNPCGPVQRDRSIGREGKRTIIISSCGGKITAVTVDRAARFPQPRITGNGRDKLIKISACTRPIPLSLAQQRAIIARVDRLRVAHQCAIEMPECSRHIALLIQQIGIIIIDLRIIGCKFQRTTKRIGRSICPAEIGFAKRQQMKDLGMIPHDPQHGYQIGARGFKPARLKSCFGAAKQGIDVELNHAPTMPRHSRLV